jgi:hypothetical protein
MNQFNNNEIVTLTATIVRQLNDLDLKVQQINTLKTIVNKGRTEFLTRTDAMTQLEKEDFLVKLEDDIKSMEVLVTNHYTKIQNTCKQHDLEIAFTVATTVKDCFK